MKHHTGVTAAIPWTLEGAHMLGHGDGNLTRLVLPADLGGPLCQPVTNVQIQSSA